MIHRSCVFVCALVLAFAPVLVRAADQTTVVALPVVDPPPAMNGVVDASWGAATQLTLEHDYTNRRAADEPTSVAIAQDAGFIDAAFTVTQREPIADVTETNGPGVLTDDYVGVFLSPNGPLGFQYAFYANPRGTRYQTSSENTAYTPPWTAVAKRTATGYTLTLRIPLNVIHAGGKTDWRAQFVRATVHANALDLWAFNEHATSSSDATYFGTLQNVGAHAASASRPRPRAQVYGLAEGTTKSQGGDTSRLGVDLSLPIAPTTSLVASIHPDYSNVDTDQQTIAPTAFAHQYTEVRPFFTQAAASFNANVINFNGPVLLYTPAIPTFRDGYAVEGTQGPFTYGAFDAVGTGRLDEAESVNYNVSNTERAFGVNVQNVAVDSALDGIHDAVTSLTTGFINNHSHEVVWTNLAQETGATVTNPGAATYAEAGVGYLTATTLAAIFYQGVGPQFAPADAYVAQSDIHGLNGFISQTWPFKANTILHDISANALVAGMRTSQGIPSQNDAGTQVNFDFSNLVTVHAYYSQSAVRTYSDQFLPFDQNGVLVGYKFSTATPSYVQYNGGPYYHGNLDAWTYLTTLKVAPRTHLTLEEDEDQYLSDYPGEHRTNLWLERPTLDVQFSRELQFDVGVRRIIGSFLPVYNAPPTFAPVSAGNVTAALHYLAHDGKSEFYAVYGDPNSLATTPAIFLKYIRYIGAPKGS